MIKTRRGFVNSHLSSHGRLSKFLAARYLSSEGCSGSSSRDSFFHRTLLQLPVYLCLVSEVVPDSTSLSTRFASETGALLRSTKLSNFHTRYVTTELSGYLRLRRSAIQYGVTCNVIVREADHPRALLSRYYRNFTRRSFFSRYHAYLF
jgi:hypothetical protein